MFIDEDDIAKSLEGVVLPDSGTNVHRPVRTGVVDPDWHQYAHLTTLIAELTTRVDELEATVRSLSIRQRRPTYVGGFTRRSRVME